MPNKKEQPFSSVLEALLFSDDPPIHLLYRLSDLTAAEFELFKKKWTGVDEERRLVITRHLADISEENYLVDFTPIFTQLFSDAAPAVRSAALDGVWDSEDTHLIPQIIKLLQTDNNVGVRAAAARALAHYILLGEWGQIDANHTSGIVEVLLNEYQKPLASIEVKRAALEAVSPAPDPRIADLILDAYEEGSDDMQLSAIFAMGNSADERWLPVLEQELTSPSADFRAEAARACGMIGSESSIDALQQLLTDEEMEVSVAAIYALGQIGGDEIIELLTRMAEDPDYEEFIDVIEEALDEMEWVDSSLDLMAFSDDDEDDDILDDLRLN